MCEIGLCLTQRLFGASAFGNVADGTGDKCALLRLQRTQTDFHGKLRSVFPPPEQPQTITHRPHPRLGEELLAVLGVWAPKPVRHQNLNLLPQQVVPLIPKQFLDLGIDQHDLALPIHDDHGIWSGFQKPAEFLFGLLALTALCMQRLVGSMEILNRQFQVITRAPNRFRGAPLRSTQQSDKKV